MNGRKIGLYFIIALTAIQILIEANPLADYSLEVDKTEARIMFEREITVIGCLLVLTASSSFKYARIIYFD